MSEQTYDTHIGEGMPVTVYYDTQPFEPATLEEPGCPAEITINAVEVNEINIESDLSEDTLDRISLEIEESLAEERDA